MLSLYLLCYYCTWCYSCTSKVISVLVMLFSDFFLVFCNCIFISVVTYNVFPYLSCYFCTCNATCVLYLLYNHLPTLPFIMKTYICFSASLLLPALSTTSERANPPAAPPPPHPLPSTISPSSLLPNFTSAHFNSGWREGVGREEGGGGTRGAGRLVVTKGFCRNVRNKWDFVIMFVIAIDR